MSKHVFIPLEKDFYEFALGPRRRPKVWTTLTNRLLYWILLLARPVFFFFFSWGSTLGVWPLTFPARAKEPWTWNLKKEKLNINQSTKLKWNSNLDLVTSQIATMRTSGNSSGLTQKCSRRFIYFQMTTHKAQVGAIHGAFMEECIRDFAFEK